MSLLKNQSPGHLGLRGIQVVARAIAAGIAGLVIVLAIGEGIEFSILTARESWLLTAMFASVAGMLLMAIPPWSHRRRILIGATISVAGIAAFYAIHYFGAGKWPGGWVFPLMFVPGIAELVCSYLASHSGSSSARGDHTTSTNSTISHSAL